MRKMIALAMLLGVGQVASGQQVFWLETGNGIYKVGLDGSGVEIILDSGDWVSGADGLAVDNFAQKVYWGDNAGRVRRANFDGSNIETVVDGRPFTPTNIALFIPPPGRAPAVGSWGLLATTLLVLGAGTVVFRRMRVVG